MDGTVEMLPHLPAGGGTKEGPFDWESFLQNQSKVGFEVFRRSRPSWNQLPEQVERGLDDNYAAAITSDVWTAGILLAQQRIKTSLITFRMFAHQHSMHSGRWWGLLHRKVDTNVKTATMANVFLFKRPQADWLMLQTELMNWWEMESC